MSATSETAATPSLDQEPIFGSFLSGVVLTFGTRLLMLAGVFGSGIIIARWLGPDGFGAYAVVNVTVALVLQIGSAGLPSANTYFIARDRNTVGPAWANAIAFALVIGILLAAGVLALGWLRPSIFGGVSTRLLAVAAISIPFQLLFILNLNVLLALNRIRQLNLFDGLLPALVLVNAVTALVLLHKQLTFLIALNTVVGSALSLVLMIYLRRVVADKRESRPLRPDAQLLKTMLAYGVKFYVSIMAGTIILRADLLIVNRFRGAAEAGVYGIASQFSFLLLMLPGVIATLLFPRVAATQDDRGEFAVLVTRHTTLVMLMTCLAAIALAYLLPIIYGANFGDATTQLLILLPGIFLMGLESVLVQHFTGTGLPAAIPWFWVITVAFNIALNLLTVPKFGARGAAVNSTLSYALIFLLVAVYFRMKTGRGTAETFILRFHELRRLLKLQPAVTSPSKASP
jgi:O-antigen/teichoic acid export membrane protein